MTEAEHEGGLLSVSWMGGYGGTKKHMTCSGLELPDRLTSQDGQMARQRPELLLKLG